MRSTAGVLKHRLDEADMTDHAALKDFAALTAQRLADRDRVRSVIGISRPERDFDAPTAGLADTMRSRYAIALDDQ